MTIQINGIEVHYELTGPENAPVVMLSHALLADSTMWDPQTDALQQFRVLRFDTRGHGRTSATPPPYDFEMLADDAKALLDALEIGSTHFVGASMGGMIGQALALKYPDLLSSLVLCDTRGHHSPDRSEARAKRIETASSTGIEPLTKPTLDSWFTSAFQASNSDLVEACAERIQATSVDGLIGCTQAIDQQNHTPQLEQIKIPSLIVVGEEDPVTPLPEAFDIHVRIDGSDMVVIPKTRHLPNMESPREFNEVLVAFLNEHSD